ncbi:hypothetical protein B7P43_G14939 [Cryptotermes secundus]|uniref:Uncharacterized protein n=1 Tax=Cryptotermes secundus TaxID=105785 RepID=A0A2J7QRJ2_9NEOP|nr:hypothetical protein B7P43_G14939 [Cryptotermes secundus]
MGRRTMSNSVRGFYLNVQRLGCDMAEIPDLCSPYGLTNSIPQILSWEHDTC